MNKQEAVKQLQDLVRCLMGEWGINDRAGYRRWLKKENVEEDMEGWFGYKRVGDMPRVTALLAPYFHPDLPLIGLNYSPVAHNTLHAFPDGWTTALRLCRGLILSATGEIVGVPFPKFFNYGEHPETTDLPDEPFEVSEKMDGHLGIIFAYDGKLRLCTRQSFAGPTAKLGGEMLAEIARKKGWDATFPRHLTVLVEIIHPKTRVHVDYGRKRGFVLIGAYDRTTLADCGSHAELLGLGKLLGIPVAERWTCASLAELRKKMKDKTVRNHEGGVAFYPSSGLRVKHKFESYIGLMVEAKLSYAYLMKRMLSGNLKRMLDTLAEEIRPKADEMVKAIRHVSRFKDEKKRREYLYALDAEKQKNQHYRGICREYLKSLSTKPKRKAAKA